MAGNAARTRHAARPAVDVGRVYDHDHADAHRVLVDRLWPRGLSKADAALDEWLRDVAPSTALRQWYHHEPSRFAEFARRYHAELDRPPASEAVEHLAATGAVRNVHLLTATRDIEHSGARVLRDHIHDRFGHTRS